MYGGGIGSCLGMNVQAFFLLWGTFLGKLNTDFRFSSYAKQPHATLFVEETGGVFLTAATSLSTVPSPPNWNREEGRFCDFLLHVGSLALPPTRGNVSLATVPLKAVIVLVEQLFDPSLAQNLKYFLPLLLASAKKGIL